MSDDYYAPNQQTVRGDESGPAEEGDGGSPPIEDGAGGNQPDEMQPVEAEETAAEALPFDPAEHTVVEVEEYVEANPGERQAVLDAELAGKGRSTLVDWLEV